MLGPPSHPTPISSRSARGTYGSGLNPFWGQISCEDCVIALEEGRILADIPHPGEPYAHQRMLRLEINHYAYIVPYVETDDELYPSRIGFPVSEVRSRRSPARRADEA